MNKRTFFVSLLFLATIFSVKSQIDFEGMLHNYQNGERLNGSFESGNYKFVNYYNESWGSWSGFSYSKMTDVTTAGYTNQFSAITGTGVSGSEKYLVANVSNYNQGTYVKLETPSILNGFYVTNSTYSYLSMLNGDSYGKQFGSLTSASGEIDGTNGEDWFLLTIKGFNSGAFTDSVNFYLADFRFSDNNLDYIINSWTFVDLTQLSNVDSLIFILSSSDNGNYGMNTPAYFCVDDIIDASNTTTNFEEFDFDFNNGADLAGGFVNGEAYFYNYYNADWDYWNGFSYSRKTDVITAGYTNQYSAITGEGYNQSETYAVSYGVSSIKFDNLYTVNNINVTNSTYSYLSMLNGDSYGKQFGSLTSASGEIDGTNGEDWFLLTIKGFNSGNFTDSVNFYLADFRFIDNNQDYILNTWAEINLASLNLVDSLTFSLTSSDNGNYGMNTPAYFCMDYITTTLTNIAEKTNTFPEIVIYPNPVKDIVNIKNTSNSTITISDISGKIYVNKISAQNTEQIDMSRFTSGVYIIVVKNENTIKTEKLIKL